MGADPEPDEVLLLLNGKRPVVEADPRGPEAADFLEME
jgi:hypothetical protein